MRKPNIRKMPTTRAEALRLEKRLLDILFIQPGLRAFRVEALAMKYDVDQSTVRQWLRLYERYGLSGITCGRRKDKGSRRLSEEALQAIVAILGKYPNLSANQLQKRLVEEHPDTCRHTRGAREGKLISTSTIRRIQQQWIDQKQAFERAQAGAEVTRP